MHECVRVTLPHPNTRVQLTGYSREEVVGRNCRFLQGPRTDQETVARLRDTVIAGGEITVKVCNGLILYTGAGIQTTSGSGSQACLAVLPQLLNYKRDGSIFWNLLHLAPVHDGKVWRKMQRLMRRVKR
eukprot:COSAG02_NODE_919_length_15936_cov_5.055314_6_plen_129_part_00